MTREQVCILLNDLLRDVLETEDVAVADAAVLRELRGWDSLREIGVFAAAEIRFGIELRAAEAERVATMGDLVDLLLEKTALLRVP